MVLFARAPQVKFAYPLQGVSNLESSQMLCLDNSALDHANAREVIFDFMKKSGTILMSEKVYGELGRLQEIKNPEGHQIGAQYAANRVRGYIFDVETVPAKNLVMSDEERNLMKRISECVPKYCISKSFFELLGKFNTSKIFPRDERKRLVKELPSADGHKQKLADLVQGVCGQYGVEGVTEDQGYSMRFYLRALDELIEKAYFNCIINVVEGFGHKLKKNAVYDDADAEAVLVSLFYDTEKPITLLSADNDLRFILTCAKMFNFVSTLESAPQTSLRPLP